MSEPTQLDGLLEILVCPKSKAELELVPLPATVSSSLKDKYREHFQDEEPVVEQGLLCKQSAWSIRSFLRFRSCSLMKRCLRALWRARIRSCEARRTRLV